MLQEVEEVVSKLVFGFQNQSEKAVEGVLNSWKDRLRLTQVRLAQRRCHHCKLLEVICNRSHTERLNPSRGNQLIYCCTTAVAQTHVDTQRTRLPQETYSHVLLATLSLCPTLYSIRVRKW